MPDYGAMADDYANNPPTADEVIGEPVRRAIRGERWCQTVIQINGQTILELNQCPICSALVFKDNEDHHESWHIGGSVDS